MSDVIFILFMIILFNAIFKSIGEKKKIQDSRMRRPYHVERQKPIMEYEDDELYDFEETDEFGEVEIEDIEEVEIPNMDYEMYDGNINVEYTKAEDMALESMETDKSKPIKPEDKRISPSSKSINGMQKDILRGIIFSEVLSEPKSVRNMKR